MTTIKFYQDLKDIKDPAHVFVFASDHEGLMGSESGKIAKDVYGRMTYDYDGFKQTSRGYTYGLPIKDTVLKFSSLEDIENEIFRFTIIVKELTEYKTWVFPNILDKIPATHKSGVIEIINEYFGQYRGDSIVRSNVVFPRSWGTFLI